MKCKILLKLLVLGVLLYCPVAKAAILDPCTISKITVYPNQRVYGWPGTFAEGEGPVSAQWGFWIDYRDPCGINNAIYGTNLNDPCYGEFLIDPCALNCSTMTASGYKVAYNVELPAKQFLRIAYIKEPNSLLKRVDAAVHKYLGSFDISGSVITYISNDPNTWIQTVYALDISDSNNIREHIIRTLPDGDNVSGLAIDANHIVWSVSKYESGSYVQIADITDLNEPNIATGYLPDQTNFENIDVSGKWLVASGRYNWNGRIFAVHNYYTDINNWEILTLWREGDNGEYYLSGPRVDGPAAVWMITTRMPSLTGRQELDNDTEWRIKSGYLMGNGNFTLSTLRQSNSEMIAAEILNSVVVWSEQTGGMDLFKGSLLLQCGDWGYMQGDLNKDCKVDCVDLAIFANDWLECTLPGGLDCQFGTLGSGSF